VAAKKTPAKKVVAEKQKKVPRRKETEKVEVVVAEVDEDAEAPAKKVAAKKRPAKKRTQRAALKKKTSLSMEGVAVFFDMDDVCSSVMSEDIDVMSESDAGDLIGMDDMNALDDADDEPHVQSGWPETDDPPLLDDTDDKPHVQSAWPETDNPPLLDIFTAIVHALSTAALLKLAANWRILSLVAMVGMGSGCTGSGLDFYAITLIAEVLAQQLEFVVEW
jgi:hypothetical protein